MPEFHFQSARESCSRPAVRAALVFALALGGSGCAALTPSRDYPLPSPTGLPSATRQYAVSEAVNVDLRRRSDGLVNVAIEVDGAPRPAQRKPPMKTYVAWLEVGPRRYVQLGELDLDYLGRGKLERHTGYQSFRLLITGEMDSRTGIPGEDVYVRSAPLMAH